MFEEKINEINWNEKLDHLNDVDEMCEEFTKCFLKIAKECIPTKIVTIRNNNRPWFNNEIRKEIRIWDRLTKNVLKFHRESDIKLYKKKQRNKVNNMKNISKENFENIFRLHSFRKLSKSKNILEIYEDAFQIK